MGQEGPTAACYQGYIFVMGGGGTNQFYIYEIATDTWFNRPALPRNVAMGHAGAFEGKIYLVGGDDDFFPGSGLSAAVDIYDIAAVTWSSRHGHADSCLERWLHPDRSISLHRGWLVEASRLKLGPYCSATTCRRTPGSWPNLHNRCCRPGSGCHYGSCMPWVVREWRAATRLFDPSRYLRLECLAGWSLG